MLCTLHCCLTVALVHHRYVADYMCAQHNTTNPHRVGLAYAAGSSVLPLLVVHSSGTCTAIVLDLQNTEWRVACRDMSIGAGVGQIEDEEGPAVRLGPASGALESAPSGNTSAAGGLTTSHSGQYDSTGQAAEGTYTQI